jgi:hypothetical protein
VVPPAAELRHANAVRREKATGHEEAQSAA